MIMNISYCMLC